MSKPVPKPASSWVWLRRPADKDPHEAGLTFTDILFGLVLAEVFRRMPELSEGSWAGGSQLFLAFTVVITSWIGYHNSKKRSKYRIHFFNAPLAKFLLDMSMVTAYWWIAVNPEGFPTDSHPPSRPSAILDVVTVLLIFLLYVAWDLVSLHMSRKAELYPDAEYDGARTLITVGATLLVFGITVGTFLSDPRTSPPVVVIDASLVFVLILYRFMKDARQRAVASAGAASGVTR